MKGIEATGQERLADDHVPAVREALARYASAKEGEDALERDRDTIFRQLAEARGETYSAWRVLNSALDEEACTGREEE